MGQVTIYLENEIEQQMIGAAKSAKLSKSKWIALLVQEKMANEWPLAITHLAGAWQDMPDLEEMRTTLGEDVPREHF